MARVDSNTVLFSGERTNLLNLVQMSDYCENEMVIASYIFDHSSYEV